MHDFLFVYGTLIPSRAPAEIADVMNALVPLGPGTVRGRLYDLGDYPGVILDDSPANSPSESAGLIPGRIFALPPDPAILARLDAYEDYRPQDAARSLFVRRRTQVTLPDSSRSLCWIYVYNQQPNNPPSKT